MGLIRANATDHNAKYVVLKETATRCLCKKARFDRHIKQWVAVKDADEINLLKSNLKLLFEGGW